MVDGDLVTLRLRALECYRESLEDLLSAGKQSYLEDLDTQLKLERALQLAIQTCIDIGAHIVADEGFESPSDYGDIFRILAQNGTIDAELAERLNGAAGTRNLLVHGYLNIDRERLWNEISLEDFTQFALQISKLI